MVPWKRPAPVGCPAFAPSCTASSATWPAASRRGQPAPPAYCRKVWRTTERNPASSTERGRGRSWPKPPGCSKPRADERRPDAVQRIELLRLRFEENLPIRAIAERWGVDARSLHHAYAMARQEFKAALLEVVAFHQPGSPRELEEEAASLLKALS